ncbi:MAG: peptide-methionine (S)-S-oxide reductase MsrA [Elusimicrobia bacterium]|nr:peptide-methionine (S)-S-oxide reductase MsrA [Elusimicrobiota bacterium]
MPLFKGLTLGLTLLWPGPAIPASSSDTSTELAAFAGGCFWCMEPPFEKIPGVISVISGYAGGSKANPAYEEVSAGGTGHAESVQVRFDPGKVRYRELLKVYWRNVDPTDGQGQFCDRGLQYRPAIFYLGQEQKALAEASAKEAARTLKSKTPLQVEIVPASAFYPAEKRHQDYYKRNPLRYKFYRRACGRDRRLGELWGKH